MRKACKWMLIVTLLSPASFSVAAEASSEAGSITGVVTIDGRLKAGLRVQIDILDPLASFIETHETRTDVNGGYKFENLPVFPVRVSVQEEVRIANDERTITRFAKKGKLEAGKITTMNLGEDMGPITLHAQVLTNQKPVAFERIYVMTVDKEAWDYVEFEAFTDGSGCFRLSGLVKGEYRVYYNDEKAGHLSKAVQINSDQEQTIEYGYSSISVPFVVPDFLRALPEGEINKIAIGKGLKNQGEYFEYISDPAKKDVKTNVEGIIDGQMVSFSGNIQGDYEVRVTFTTAVNCQYGLKLPERRTISTATTQADQRPIQLPEYTIGSLRLNITNASGAPAANIPVTLHWPRGEALTASIRARTDEQGMVEFPALIEGAYTVELTSPTGAPSTRHPIEVKGTLSQKLQTGP